MSTHTAVPSDIEADSFIDLVDDCREVSSVLAPYVVDLTTMPQRHTPAFLIPAQSADRLEGYEVYGS